MKYFIYGVILLVAAAIIGAFIVVGSPAKQRALRFDEQRLNDLQNLQYQISNYFASKEALPGNLSDMNGFQGFSVPVDPETKAAYEYSVQAKDKFRLCATFAYASGEGSDNAYYPRAVYGPEPASTWQHPAGHACFDLTLEQPLKGAVPPITVKPVPAG